MGTRVGAAVVGARVGAAVGAFVGASVGASVGDFVGIGIDGSGLYLSKKTDCVLLLYDSPWGNTP